MGYRLGIDLGTTFTAAAFIDDAGPRMLELGDRNLTMPSVLFLTEEGALLFGETAERRSWSEPERVLREFKRRIGDTVPIVVGAQTFSPSALQTELLRRVLQIADERLGGPPDQVVVTYPANWGLFKIQLMRDIVTDAGIPGALLCPEPVAAAIEYAAKQRVPVGAKVAVYDLGGGTFDVAVLEKTDDGFEIIGTPLGVDHLGGLDFDEAVLADAVSKLALGGLDPDDPATAPGLSSLRRDCIEAKEALSSDVTTDITSLLPGAAGHRARLTRSEFEALIRPALEESVRTTVRALRLAGVDNTELHAVVLVGGSSRIPLVTELLNREVAVPVAADTFPKHDIALGAARYARLQLPEQTTSSAASPTQATDDTTPLPPDTWSATNPWATNSPDAWATSPSDQLPPSDEPRPNDQPPPNDGADRRSSTEAERPTRKTPARLIIAVIVICLVVGTGIVVASLRSAGKPHGSSDVASSSASAPPASPDQSTLDLPAGDALSVTQLIVPRYKTLDPPSQLWLADVEDRSSARPIDKVVQHGSAYGVELSPDRQTITYVDAGDSIRAMPAAGGKGRRLFKSPPGCGKIRHMSWSPTDLSLFVLECHLPKSPSRLMVVNIDGTIVRELDTGGMSSSDPSISPNGTSVAFWAGRPPTEIDGGSIYTMPVDGSAPPHQVTVSAAEADSYPSWSPDGAMLSFQRRIGPPVSEGSDDDGPPEDIDIMVVPAVGGTPTTLVSGPATDDKPAWSPDGAAIAFVSNRNAAGHATKHKDIWVVPAAGGKPTRLHLTSPRIAAPAWWRR